jgi:hypothetical protein
MMIERNTNTLSDINDNDKDSRSILIYPFGKKKIPLFLEFLLTITRVIVIVIAVLVITLSLIAKASWLDVAIRVGISIFVLGLLGILFNWLIGRQYIHSAVSEMKEIENKNNRNENSFHVEA